MSVDDGRYHTALELANRRIDRPTDRPTDVSAYLPIEGTLI